jgi:RNA polymerase sigma-70 factor (ECF subfamily)
MNRSINDGSATGFVDADGTLVQQAQEAPEGDLRAFEKLIVRYQGWVIANCRYITRDPNNAEDLAQEVLIKAFFGLRSFERTASFGHWLKRIKVHHCLNHLKKHSGRSYVGIEEPDVSGFDQLTVQTTAEQFAEELNDRLLISAVLDSMSASLRIPLILCDMDGLSYEEVAQSLSIGLSATKMRIKRAREEFRKRYVGVQAVGLKAIGK